MALRAGADREVLLDYLIYIAILAVFTAPVVGWRDLYMTDEVRYPTIVREMIANDTWWRLTIDGVPYLDKPPLFFALARLYVEAVGSTSEAAFLSLVPVTGLLLLAATRFFLAAAGFEQTTIRAACLILLSFPATVLHLNFFRMDLLFAALILFSLGALLLGLGRAGFSMAMVAGGLLAALAALVKGPLGILFPFASVIVLECVRGQPRRLVRADLATAIIVALVPFLAWLAMVAGWVGVAAMPGFAEQQVVDRVLGRTDQSYPWWYFLAALPVATLPWIFLAPATVDAGRAGSPGGSSSGCGLAAVLSYLAVVFISLSSIGHKIVYYISMFLPALAALAAAGFVRLERQAPRRLSIFYTAVATACLVLPFAAAWALGFVPRAELARLKVVVSPEDLRPFAIASGFCAVPLLAGAWLKGIWRLSVNIAVAGILILTTKAFLLPKANNFLSAKPLIAKIDRLVPADEPLFLYRAFYGALLYYYDHPHHYAMDEARFRQLLAEDPSPHYVMMPAAIFETDPKWRAEFKPIGSFGILLQRTLLLKSVD